MKFRCDCGDHLLELKLECGKFPILAVAIYRIHSLNTGRKLKKPKLEADVVIMDNASPHELLNIMKYLHKTSRKYLERVGEADYMRKKYGECF